MDPLFASLLRLQRRRGPRPVEFAAVVFSLLLLTSCSGRGTSHVPGKSGHSALAHRRSDSPIETLAESLIAKLPDPSLVTRFSITKETSSEDLCMSMVSDARGAVSQFQAQWEGEVVLADVWRESGGETSPLAGGDLKFDGSSPDNVGFQYTFSPGASKYLFTDEHDNPSPLTVDQTSYTEDLDRFASAHSLPNPSLTFSDVGGSDLIDDQTVPHGSDFAVQTNPFGDPGSLEGVLLVVRDGSGAVRFMWSYSAGLQSAHSESNGGASSDDGFDVVPSR